VDIEEEPGDAGLQAAAHVEARVQRVKRLLAEQRDASDEMVLSALESSPDIPRTWRIRMNDMQDPAVLRDDDGVPIALAVEVATDVEVPSDAVTEDDESARSTKRRRVLLSDHSAGVRDRAQDFATKAGLRSDVVDDVALAAYLHDAGKAHPAFKRWMYGGDELAATGPALAKSDRVVLERAARARADLPHGARHEAASVRFALAHPAFGRAHDPDLVLWLIGTHHGWGRPFFPAVTWPARGDTFEADLGDGVVTSRPGPQVEDLGAGWPDLFERLRRRYGPSGLARLEAVLRLADHRRSQDEQSSTEEQ
jgi:CRISPR-associated endonuclease/helicase Cas3